MKNFFNTFGKLPMGGQLMDLCFCDADVDGDRQNGGGLGIGASSGASASLNPKVKYAETIPLDLLPSEEKQKTQTYLQHLQSQNQNPKKDY